MQLFPQSATSTKPRVVSKATPAGYRKVATVPLPSTRHCPVTQVKVAAQAQGRPARVCTTPVVDTMYTAWAAQSETYREP